MRISSASSTFCQRSAESRMPASVSAAATPSQAAVPADHSGTSSCTSNEGTCATRTISMAALTAMRTPSVTACFLVTVPPLDLRWPRAVRCRRYRSTLRSPPCAPPAQVSRACRWRLRSGIRAFYGARVSQPPYRVTLAGSLGGAPGRCSPRRPTVTVASPRLLISPAGGVPRCDDVPTVDPSCWPRPCSPRL